jgi:hypothetical protein
VEDLNASDFEKIRELWLIKWHESSSFSSKPIAEQWVIVIKEYLSRRKGNDNNTGSKSRDGQDRA